MRIAAPNILFICLHSPFKTATGGHQRTNLIFSALTKAGKVDLICFEDDLSAQPSKTGEYDIKHMGNVRTKLNSHWIIIKHRLRFFSPYCIHVKDAECAQIVQNILRQKQYDRIVVRYLETVFICGLFHRNDLIVDVDDMPQELYRTYFMDRQLRWSTRLMFLYNFILSGVYSRKFLKRTAHAFFPNSSQVGASNTSWLPNIPHPSNTSTSLPASVKNNKVLLFLGSMGYGPNWMGVNVFIENVWGKVIAAEPDAIFNIVGRNTPDEFARQWKRHKGVQLKGPVEDVVTEYLEAELVVAPIYHGAGTNIKVLEGMALGRTCIISDFAGRGLKNHLIHRDNVLIAENFEDYAALIVEVMRNSCLNEAIRNNARETIRTSFSAEAFELTISEVIADQQ